jgi:hypothetical protein
MNEELKKKLQSMIDHDFELAEKEVARLKAKGWKTPNVQDTFCFFVCWDLAREFGLDMKGVDK